MKTSKNVPFLDHKISDTVSFLDRLVSWPLQIIRKKTEIV